MPFTATPGTPIPPPESSATSPGLPGSSNLSAINGFLCLGCLGSPSGYPGFGEIVRDPAMTPQICAALALGKSYMGVYF
ncbi:hypothetical protein LX36DRAFT_716921, partial [Colletotrichum falcatum]